MPSKPIHVFLVEDESEAREGLISIIDQDERLKVCGSAASLKEARRWISDGRHNVDVLLVDLGLPDGSGLDLISECCDLRPEAMIIVMTMFADERHVFSALERGAAGYLLKSSSAFCLAESVCMVHSGGSPITPTIARMIIKRMTLTPRSDQPIKHSSLDPPPPLGEISDRLSAREVDVLNHIAVGYTTNEIAEKLYISGHTVTSHIRNVYKKLHVHSRSAAIFEAQKRGLIKSSTP
jgi:DNA-binding NarL/FixJ family response regulator